ncbi:hypothetical protein AJ79_09170 [Helicocarpus griseus UAMH5409]|uniref:3-oxoacyl-[acyl-carrier-protein] reductase n=1 Tax=Helicocarpus griseus UAMH5409 TaxID=1447875 RepID=A0A2B7WLU7_9EURO|nr:hypothetical protein AJ79_09170 [Helicocarpus griseus UAMH5409]
MSTGDLSGTVVAISGAASGIGRGVAVLLAKEGVILSLADSNAESLRVTAELIRAEGGQCKEFVVDVRDGLAVDSWVSQTVASMGLLQGAVNCAGVLRKGGTGAPITAKSDEDWDFVLDINLTGMFKCMRAQLSNLCKGGSVVNITSSAGMMGLPSDAPYCASKHGIIGLTKSAAKEVADQGIRVNCVAPGTIDTPMLGVSSGKTKETLMHEIKGHTPLARMGSADEVAKAVLFLLDNNQSSFITGTVLSVDGGMTA